jgi:hypothetical protein
VFEPFFFAALGKTRTKKMSISIEALENMVQEDSGVRCASFPGHLLCFFFSFLFFFFCFAENDWHYFQYDSGSLSWAHRVAQRPLSEPDNSHFFVFLFLFFLFFRTLSLRPGPRR